MTNQFVDYRMMSTPGGRIELSKGSLYQYIWASNGIFIFSENSCFRVLAPVRTWNEAEKSQQVRGLYPLTPSFYLKHAKVNMDVLLQVLILAYRNIPNEVLMYLSHSSNDGWFNILPVQENSPTSCKAKEYFPYCPIEVHSHNTMDAFFSKTDDAEETGLRIYAVLGRVTSAQPQIRVRVGIYGHFWTIPYQEIFEPMPAVRNA
jgi:hypothetical protein